MDPAIHQALTLVVRLAEKEDDEMRTPESAQFVSDMRRAAGIAEVYELAGQHGRPSSRGCLHFDLDGNGRCLRCGGQS